MKIKFLAFSYTKPYSFNPIYYWLKSFYKKNGKHYDSYEWLPTEYFFTEDIVDRIIEEGTDVLCLSVYLWNFESQMKVAKEVHEREPDIQIIVGGPECHANIRVRQEPCIHDLIQPCFFWAAFLSLSI